jgi:hypothetical protein
MVQLREDVAQELQTDYQQRSASHRQLPETRQLLAAVRQMEVELVPVHPGQTHPLLAPYFTVEVADQTAGEEIAARLQETSLVEAAYLQPAADLP